MSLEALGCSPKTASLSASSTSPLRIEERFHRRVYGACPDMDLSKTGSLSPSHLRGIEH